MSDSAATSASKGSRTTAWRIEPERLLSRHFNLYCDDELVTTLHMTLWREGCDFAFADHAFAIRRKSIWKDAFQLLADEDPVCDVLRKPLSRRFELKTQHETWTLQRNGWLSRTYQLLAGEREVGTVVPAGWLTRRRVATFAAEVPPPVQTLAIFLVLVIGQRQNNSGGA